MSRRTQPEIQHNRPSFASRTAFDYLPVDDVEESDEEPEREVSVELQVPKQIVDPNLADGSGSSAVLVGQVPKVTKSAQKKAAKAAREHGKQQKEKSKSQSLSVTDSTTPDAPAMEYTPVEMPKEAEIQSPAVLEPQSAAEPPSSSAAIRMTNGHALTGEQSVPQPLPSSASYTKPPPFPSSPIDMARRKASQPLSIRPIDNNDGSLPQKSPKTAAVDNTPLDSIDEAQIQKDREAEITKKKQNVFVRTLWTLIMISGFLLCLALGHGFMIILVMVCQTLVYREVTALFALGVSKSDDDESKGKDPWSKTLNWYFFAVTNYFLYGESLIYYFKHVVFADAQLLPFATNHRFISFMLYLIGFVGFVASLQKQYLKSQFGLFCWVHMSLLVIVVSSHFIINNILEGLIWFWVPASLVICNDVFAYICGITLGRTPLIKLSPKKTVEGFVGAFFCTVLFGLLWGTLFMRFDYMICPAHNLGVTAFNSDSCQPNSVFVWREWEMWAPLRIAASTLLGRTVTTLPYATYQFHLLIMSCFASLVAPFGGFFASGFKRAFDIKDFGHSIPGHGGMTDRMDCQFLMGVFTYVYYSSLIREHHVTVGSVLQTIVSSLTLDEQIELMTDFKRYLEGKGIHV